MWARSVLGGLTIMERYELAGVNLAYTQLLATVAAAGSTQKIPPLTDFMPDLPAEEPAEEPARDFGGWARSLLALAS